MKNYLIKLFVIVLAAVICFGTVSVYADTVPVDEETVSVTDIPVIHETEFGGVYAEITIEDFNACGFEYGDGVSVSFSNGYIIENIPYYNGFYTLNKELQVIAYPGYPYIKILINNGADLWDIAELDETCTVSISVYESAEFIDIQKARNITYVDDPEQFPSKEIFANFRCMEAEVLKPGLLYRSASPCDNQHQRAPFVSSLAEEAGIKTILDLADTDEKIQGYLDDEWEDHEYFLKLYESGSVIPIALKSNYELDEFKQSLAAGLTEMTEHQGPYLIHCTEGKDRTGFVCMLLEALAGAEYEAIEADYMITYQNYYSFDHYSDPGKYDAIVETLLVPMIQALSAEEVDIFEADLSECAEEYLLSAGMTEEQIEKLKELITE